MSIRSEFSRRKDFPKRTLIIRCDNLPCGRTFEKKFFQHIADAAVHACSRRCQGELQRKGAALDLLKREVFTERYGVDNPLKDPVIRDRVRTTNVERYGVPVSSQNDDVKARARKTNRELFGVDWHTQSTNFNEKARVTWLTKYGVDHPMRSDVIKAKYDFVGNTAKAHETKKANGTYARSRVEDAFASVLIELFGPDDVQRQIPMNGWIVDFYVKSLATYVQFDGRYWHGLDRPLDVIRESADPRDAAIVQAWERDRRQDAWFTEQNMRLVRVTDLEFGHDSRACILRVLGQQDE